MSQELTVKWTEAPIAICLSGGGYRAAAFHLGSLAYLNRVNLLRNACSLSTVSGGTITGAMYVLSLIEEQPFEKFYHDYSAKLEHTHLLKQAFSLLGKTPSTPAKRRNIIVSMAEVYANQFYKRPDGRPYCLGDIRAAGQRLPDVSFNATEYRTGVAFRFQTREGAVTGNGNVPIPQNIADGIRVADIVAASSCFPGGFEPLSFPDDFVWQEQGAVERIAKELRGRGGTPSVALMDGGVYDNQGASELDLAVGGQAEKLSIFLISDADQNPDILYEYPKNAGLSGFLGKRSLAQVRMALRILNVLCALSIIAIGGIAWQRLAEGRFSLYDIILYLLPLLLVAATFLGNWWLRGLIYDLLKRVPQMGDSSWQDLKGMTISQLVAMVHVRITSLFATASAVFMKRIRRLTQDAIYKDPKYEGKRSSNLIYELASVKEPAPGLPPPSEKLRKLAKDATATSTALWFDNAKQQLPDLVACGQATTCYNLLKVIRDRFGDNIESYPPDVKVLYNTLAGDWASFCQDPMALLRNVRALERGGA